MVPTKHTPIAGVIQSSILRLFEAILVHFGGILGLSKTPAADKRPLPKFCVKTGLSEAWGLKLIEESEEQARLGRLGRLGRLDKTRERLGLQARPGRLG